MRVNAYCVQETMCGSGTAKKGRHNKVTNNTGSGGLSATGRTLRAAGVLSKQ